MTYPERRPRDWVVTDTAGPLLAWLEYPGRRPDCPELWSTTGEGETSEPDRRRLTVRLV